MLGWLLLGRRGFSNLKKNGLKNFVCCSQERTKRLTHTSPKVLAPSFMMLFLPKRELISLRACSRALACVIPRTRGTQFTRCVEFLLEKRSRRHGVLWHLCLHTGIQRSIGCFCLCHLSHSDNGASAELPNGTPLIHCRGHNPTKQIYTLPHHSFPTSL